MSFPQIAYKLNLLTQLPMEIFDKSESLSTEINADSSFESGDFDIGKEDFSFGYPGEQEYKEEELENNEEKGNLSRQGNLHLYKSLHCTVKPIFMKCKCCKELKDLDL